MSTIIPQGSQVRIEIDRNSKKVDGKIIPLSSLNNKQGSKNAGIEYLIVKKIQEQCLVVDEFESYNGKALIKCQAKSKSTGKYTYLFFTLLMSEKGFSLVKIEYTITSLSLLHEDEYKEIHANEFLTC